MLSNMEESLERASVSKGIRGIPKNLEYLIIERSIIRVEELSLS
jgi:hypothetical protein